MGEQSGKPKVEGQRRPHYKARQQKGYQPPAAAKPAAFSAPTAGYENKVFTYGQPDSAAVFEEVRKALSRYVASYRKGGAMAQEAIDKLIAPTFNKPPPLGPNPDKWDELEWDHKAKVTMDNKETWEDVKTKVYNLLLEHAHPMLETAMQGEDEWKAVSAAKDPIGLMKLIRQVVLEGAGLKGEAEKAVNNWIRLLCTHQQPKQDLEKYNATFKANTSAMEAAGSKPGLDYGLWMYYLKMLKREVGLSDSDVAPDDMLQEAMDKSCEAFLSILLIKLADNSEHRALKIHLHNKGLTEKDAWPATQEKAYSLLQNFEPEANAKPTPRPTPYVDAGVNFAEVAGDRVCYGCRKKTNPPHSWRKCPELSQDQKSSIQEKLNGSASSKETVKDAMSNVNIGEEEEDFRDCIDGVNNLNVQGADEASIQSFDYQEMDSGDESVDGVSFQQPAVKVYRSASSQAVVPKARRSVCNKDRGYLDSGATQHSCCNLGLLEDRHVTKITLRQHCNAGVKYTNRMGRIGPLLFWENGDGIANLISLSQCEADGWEFDYKTGGTWVAYMPDGARVDFSVETEGPCAGMSYVDLTRLEDQVLQERRLFGSNVLDGHGVSATGGQKRGSFSEHDGSARTCW